MICHASQAFFARGGIQCLIVILRHAFSFYAEGSPWRSLDIQSMSRDDKTLDATSRKKRSAGMTAKLIFPVQRATRLILNHARFKEVFLFFKVHHFTHPREWICSTRILLC